METIWGLALSAGRWIIALLKPILDIFVKRIGKDIEREDEVIQKLSEIYLKYPDITDDEKGYLEANERKRSKASIKIVSRGHEFEGQTFFILPDLPFVIGRDDVDSDNRGKRLILPNYEQPDMYSMVSRSHCILRIVGAQVYIHDTNSTYGTFVNEQRLRAGEHAALSSNDKIRLGKLRLRFAFIAQ